MRCVKYDEDDKFLILILFTLLQKTKQDPTSTAATTEAWLKQPALNDFVGPVNYYSAQECVNADGGLVILL